MLDKKNSTRILFLGDISGTLGRKGVIAILPKWKKKYQRDITIGNIENLAHNKGITIKTLEEIVEAGVEMFTGGNHIWKKYDLNQLAEETNYKIACPANDSRCPKK